MPLRWMRWLHPNRFGGRSLRQSFVPSLDPYRETIARMPPRNLVVVGLPDQLHFDAVMAALEADQHVIAVKPLVLKASEAETIRHEGATAPRPLRWY